MTEIKCKYCGMPVPPAQVDVVLCVARCAQCGAIFDFAAQLPVASLPDTVSRAPGRSPVPLPRILSVAQTETELRLTRYWVSWQALGLVVVSVAVGCRVLDFGGQLLQGLARQPFTFSLLCFPVTAGLLVGVGVVYYVAAQLCNRTIITANREMLDLYSGPLWVPGDRRFRPADVQQLYCVERPPPAGHQAANFKYEVRVQLRNGQTHTLLTKLPEADQALYIEQEIERFLGIPDVSMPGELARR